MATGWRYRVAGVLGTVSLTGLAVTVANRPFVQQAFAQMPFFGNPAPNVVAEGQMMLTIWTAVFVMLAAMWPLYKPRPRRILDTIMLTQKRILLGMVALAAMGYFKYSHRIPRSTLMLTTVVLLVVLPAWLLLIRRQPQSESRAIIVGDDHEAMTAIREASDLPILGTVAPPSPYERDVESPAVGIADGGGESSNSFQELPALGGLSRLEDVLVDHDIDTALLAFGSSDRAEFFGTLATCHEHGVRVKAHREHADSVLLGDAVGDDVVEIDLEPWDWQTLVVKRLFDIAFATSGLLVLSPLMGLIALAIKLDSPGPLLYAQERTAEFGERFTVYKFRSMVPDAEAATGVKLSEEDAGDVDPRVTRIGQFLRRTHLDEIPQLWSILVGDMSVVGPRPERPELDEDIEEAVGEWRRRWFVKPGLTGLAQIRGATGFEPERKLRYDIEYVRRQSFWFDLKIIIRQIWQIGTDIVELSGRSSD